MTVNKTEKIAIFFELIKNMGFWSRVFFWTKVRDNSIEAFEQYKLLLSEQERLSLLASKSETLLRFWI